MFAAAGLRAADAVAAAPAFAQAASEEQLSVGALAGLPVTLPSEVTAGNRLVVEVEMWNFSGPTAGSVTDSAGNEYTRVLSRKASEGTDLTVWTAPVTAGDGTRPTITVRPTANAHMGVSVVEYAGLSPVAGASVVDQLASASGTTAGASATVASGPTAATAQDGGLAIGFYTDSGFGVALTADAGWAERVNVSPDDISQRLVEDRVIDAGATPNATVRTGANTTWQIATIVFRGDAGAAPPQAPSPPGGVSASAGDGSAAVTWTAPSSGGSPITSYTVTPFAGAAPQASKTVSGSPPATSTTVAGLANGTEYTFRVTATNAVGTGPESPASNPVTPAPYEGPAFVQRSSAERLDVTAVAGLPVTPQADVTAGNRLVVAVEMWNFSGPTAGSVTDSAGNQYTRVLSRKASEGTDLTVWTAPVTAGGGTRPTITVRPTANAHMGVSVVEYAGLSPVGDGSVVDRLVSASGTTSGAGTVASGPTAATTGAGLAVGVYVDSGFNVPLTADAAFTERVNVSPDQISQRLVEDRVVEPGATPNATVRTGANTTWQLATIVFKAPGSGAPPQAPGAPTAVSASGGDGSANVSWTAPSSGGSPITSYMVTPFAGAAPQASKTVSGSPPATSTTVAGLTNGTAYTFKVTATNDVGAGPASTASNAVTPAPPAPPPEVDGPTFVQEASARQLGVGAATGLPVTPASNVTAGNRLIVAVEMWGAAGATAGTVTDSAGNQYTRVLSRKASEGTDLTVWTAPVTAGGGTRPTITAKPTSTASMGVAVVEYAGLSPVADGSVVDQLSSASGTTASAATVASGPTAATSEDGGLALGFYTDSGFGVPVTADAGWTERLNVSPDPISQMVIEERVVSGGATPNATASTGANTTWQLATIVFKPDATGPPQAPGAPTAVSATAGDGSAHVRWSAPSSGGSPITGYTVTPYIGSQPQAANTVTGSPPERKATITGLANGTAYTFKVTAANAVGSGPASAASNAVTPVPGGEWSPVLDWPLVAVHTVLLNTGDFLLWDGWSAPQPTSLWNPGNSMFPTFSPFSSIFCAGVTQMPDGRILVAGGHGSNTTGELGIVDTNIFDPTTSAWTRVADMNFPRWYPGLTELADGRYVAISGNSINSSTWVHTPEVYDPERDEWTLLPGVSTDQVTEEEYPITYLAPNDKVFTVGVEEDLSFFLDVPAETWTQVGGKSGIENGSSVMYRPGQVLYSGGAATLHSIGDARTDAATIDLTAAQPDWQDAAPMTYPRVYHKLTMMADGKVLAVGGEPQSDSRNVTSGIMPSEIWDPATGEWTIAAPISVPRNYHSTGVLMPDGRILFAGGGHVRTNSGPGQKSAQIYSPPYLSRGPRPTITSAPDVATYGANVTLATPDAASIRSVHLVSLGADTHQIDMSQHFVPLDFTAGPGTLDVEIPDSAALAPPAGYMLFVVDEDGVPSVASFVELAPALSAPAAPTGVSATGGDASATVSWTAPSSGGSPITGYTVTPYAGSEAQAPKTVAGSATSTTVDGLANGTAYTFKVTATNAVGTSPASAASSPVTPSSTVVPSFVQSVAGQRLSVGATAGLPVIPRSNVTAGNRLIVAVEMWSDAGATADTVTDSAGNQYTRLLSRKASEGTELSVWTAPVTAGGGTRPTLTVKPTSMAHLGAAVAEYSGMSSAGDASVVDRVAYATGTTGAAAAVASGPTAGTSQDDGLAVGFYTDSGFGVPLTADANWTERLNVSPNDISQMVIEDRLVAAGSTPSAAVSTGANTTWQVATIVFKPAGSGGG